MGSVDLKNRLMVHTWVVCLLDSQVSLDSCAISASYCFDLSYSSTLLVTDIDSQVLTDEHSDHIIVISS